MLQQYTMYKETAKPDVKVYEAVGHLLQLELSGCDAKLLDSVSEIKLVMFQAINNARLTCLRDIYHRFNPQGVSAIALLEESHLAIHTYPEHGRVSVTLFACGKNNPEIVIDTIAKGLKAKEKNYLLIKTGERLDIVNKHSNVSETNLQGHLT